MAVLAAGATLLVGAWLLQPSGEDPAPRTATGRTGPPAETGSSRAFPWATGNGPEAATDPAPRAGGSREPPDGRPAAMAGLRQSPESETGSPPTEMPRPVPLGRETRDPQAATRLAAQQQADHERQLADSSAPRSGQQLTHAAVLPQDLGVAFLPGAHQDRAQSSRTQEAGYGRTVSTRLSSHHSLTDATRFYRDQLQRLVPGGSVDEQRDPTGLTTLAVGDPDGRRRVTVLLSAPAPGHLSVTLTRWEADTGAAADGQAETGR